ncbi:MAG TPA: hypothetical protein VFX08_13705 [Gaiella sp.]|nr:hypothetical protein [Gaiella sp.]HEX5584724.1 hypothetical protein [Gaiella sp.]
MSADGPDAVYLGPAFGARIEQAGDAAEPLEQDTSSSARDPRHGGEDLDAWHRRLRGGARASRDRLSCVTHSKTMKPESRVRRTTAPQEPDTELEDRQERSADGIWMPRPSVEVVALDEQDRRDRLVADLSDLSPEAPPAERTMQIGNRLALDHDTATDSVVTRRERFDRDSGTEPLESGRNTASSLEHIRHDDGDRVGARRVLVLHTVHTLL